MKKTLVLLLALLLFVLPLSGALASVSLPAGLKAIEAEAFDGNSAFTGVVELPGGIRSVGDHAFRDTNIFGLKLPAAIREIGDGILESSGSTYAIVGNASPVLSSTAFKDIDLLVGKAGGTVDRWASDNDIAFYPMDLLFYKDGFAYLWVDGTDLMLAFPSEEHSGSVTIPQSVYGAEVVRVSPYAFTNLSGVTTISLPDTLQDSMPEIEVNWPAAKHEFYATEIKNVIYPSEVKDHPEDTMELAMAPEGQITLSVGDTIRPDVIEPPISTWRDYCTWISSDKNVLTVDETGLVTAVGEGTAAITASIRVFNPYEYATPGEPAPEFVYYAVSRFTVEANTPSVDIYENTIDLTVGQVYYPSIRAVSNSTLETVTLSAEIDSADVADVTVFGKEMMIAAKAAGKATVTLTAEYDGKTASDTVVVKVSEPKLDMNFDTLLTYTGYTHNLRAETALPDGASLSFASENTEIASVNDEGVVTIGDKPGETVITAAAVYADGSTASAEIPVSVKPWIAFINVADRKLFSNWNYYKYYEDLQPQLVCDLWPHDAELLRVWGESANTDIVEFVTEYYPGYDEELTIAHAKYKGETDVTWYAELDIPAGEDSNPPYTTVEATQHVTVTLPNDMGVHLSVGQMNLDLGKTRGIDMWWEGSTAIQRAYLYSDDPSIAAIDSTGEITARSEGHTQIHAVIEAWGATYEAVCDVYVSGWEVSFEPEELYLAPGESAYIMPHIAMPDGKEGIVDNHRTGFASNNEEIATVTDAGLVTALTPGTTVVDMETFVYNNDVMIAGEGEEPFDNYDNYSRVRAYCVVHVVDSAPAITFEGEGQTLENGILMVYPRTVTQLKAFGADGKELDNVVFTPLDLEGSWRGNVSESGELWMNSSTSDDADYFYVRATAEVDGEEVSAILTILTMQRPAVIEDMFLYNDLSAGAKVKLHYTVRSQNDGAGFTLNFVSVNPSIAEVVTENGEVYIAGKAEGYTTIRGLVYDENGVLCNAYPMPVVVGDSAPVPDENTLIAFEYPHYFFDRLGEEWSIYPQVIVEPEALREFHGVTFSVADDRIARFDGEELYYNWQLGTTEIYAQIGDYVGRDAPRTKAQVTVGVPKVVVTAYTADGEEIFADAEGNLSVMQGDEITVNLVDFPAFDETGIIPEHLRLYVQDPDLMRITGSSEDGKSYTLTAMQEGFTGLNLEIQLGQWFEHYSFGCDISAPEAEFRFENGAIIPMSVGETVGLMPDFGWQKALSVKSSNPDVVAVSINDGSAERWPECPVHLTAEGLGRATVTAEFLLNEEGETAVAMIDVLAVEEHWALVDMGGIPNAMVVGEKYPGHPYVQNTGYIWPILEFKVSDPDLLEIEMPCEENDFTPYLIPRKPGVVTLTITAMKETGEPQTISGDILITAPAIRLAPESITLRPGAYEPVQLQVNTDMPVTKVVWSMDDAGIAEIVTDSECDFYVQVMANEDAYKNRSLIRAQVFFENGNYAYAAAWADILLDQETEMNPWLDTDHIELSMGETHQIERQLHGNTPLTNEYFVSRNPEVATVSATGIIYPVAPGETTIAYTAESYGATATALMTVVVRGYEASLNTTELHLGLGSSMYIVPTITGGEPDNNQTEFFSANEAVATVDHLGLVTATGLGTTTICYRTNVYDETVQLYCTVYVDGAEEKLSIGVRDGEGNFTDLSAITLYPREEMWLTAYADGELESGLEWNTTDAGLVLVDGGFIKCMQRELWDGERRFAIISVSGVVDGEMRTDYLTVEVLPSVVNIDHAPNFYHIGVGESTMMQYTINKTDADIVVNTEFVIVNTEGGEETIATVNSLGEITGVKEGTCMVRLNLSGEDGALLASGASYVFVGDTYPQITEDTEIAFAQDKYILPFPREHEVYTRTQLAGEDADWLLTFDYEPVYESSNPDVVEVFDDGNLHALSEGEATVTAWLKGYEDGPVATAKVIVGDPEPDVTVHTPDGDPYEGDMHSLPVGSHIIISYEDVLEGVPVHWHQWDYDGNALDIVRENEHELEFYVNGDWFTNVDFRYRLAPEGHEFSYHLDFDALSAPKFGQTFMYAAIGEEIDELWPDFKWWGFDRVFIEDVKPDEGNESGEVIRLVENDNCPFAFEAVGLGTAKLCATVGLPFNEEAGEEQEFVKIACVIEVLEDYWNLDSLDSIPSVMQAGRTYEPWPIQTNYGYYWPAIDWEIRNEDVLQLVETDEGERLEAIAPGRTTLTVYAWKGSRSEAEENGTIQSLSKEILVTVPAVHFEANAIDLRPGATMHVPLILNLPEEAMSGAKISFYSDDNGLAATEFAPYTYEDGTTVPGVRITGVNAYNDCRVFARVEMADGSVLGAALEVDLIPDWEIWVNAYNDYEDGIWLGMGELARDPMEEAVWQGWEHNASHFDEPHKGSGTDTAWIEWKIEDENVAYFDGFYECDPEIDDGREGPAPWNNGPIIHAKNPGDTVIRTKLTLFNANGDEIGSSEDEIPVHVAEPEINVWAQHDRYDIEVNEGRYVRWEYRYENAMEPSGIKTYTDDPSIAVFDRHGNIIGVNPGETTARTELLIGDQVFGAETHIVVHGPEFRLTNTSLTLQAGGYAIHPGFILNPNGAEAERDEKNPDDTGIRFASRNPAVAGVASDGSIYGIAGGETVVDYWINFRDFDEILVSCYVTVEGDAPEFVLDHSAMTLWPEQTAQLKITTTSDDPIREDTIVWTSDDEYIVSVDGEGNLTACRADAFDYGDRVVLITCEAETESGRSVSAVCTVTVKSATVRIREHQFGDGRWEGMSVGDWLFVHEWYETSDPDLSVETNVWFDEPAEGEAPICEFRDGHIVALRKGNVMAHFTVTASNGETYTRDLMIRVDQYTMPDSIEPEYELYVAHSEWGQHYAPINVYPEYTGVELKFTSSDPDILSFKEGENIGEMYFHDKTGLATVSVTCPENEALSTRFDVLVLGEDEDFYFAATQGEQDVETDENGVATFAPGDTFKLDLRNIHGVELPEGTIESIEYRNYYDDDQFTVTEDGLVTITQMWDELEETKNLWAFVNFSSGLRLNLCYSFYVDSGMKPFFQLSPVNSIGVDHFTLAPGSGMYLKLHTNQEWTSNPEYFTYSSSNPAVATAEFDPDEDGILIIGKSEGKATITATIPLDDGKGNVTGETMTDTFEITVAAPTSVDSRVGWSSDSNVLYVGEEIELYTMDPIEEELKFVNFDRWHEYTVDDPNVADLTMNLDGEEESGERGFMTLRAVAPGVVTVTSEFGYRNYPELGTDIKTMTFYVIEAYPVSFEQSSIKMRARETRVLPLIVNLPDEEIAAISFYSEDEERISVESYEDFTYEDGSSAPAVKLTGLRANEDCRVTAVVTTISDTEYRAVLNVHMVPDWEVWAEAYNDYHDGIHLSTTEFGHAPMDITVWQQFNTNAALLDESQPFSGTDTAWIEWDIEDDSIAYIDESEGADPFNNGVTLRAKNPGDTVIRTHTVFRSEEGNVIAETDDEIHVHVTEPVASLSLEADSYQLVVGRSLYVNYNTTLENAASPAGYTSFTEDPHIAEIDLHGNLIGVAPGETTLHVQMPINGQIIEDTALVTVNGVDFGIEKETLTLNAGELGKPIVWLNQNGFETSEIRVRSSNPSVADILSDGSIYGVSAGEATVIYSVDIADIGEVFAYCRVTVNGEAPEYAFDRSVLALYPEEETRLMITTESDDPIREGSMVWSSSDEHLVSVDEEGKLTACRVGEVGSSEQVVTITCEAETENGVPVSMACTVTVKEASVRINEHQFGEGRWVGLNVDDWHYVHETYSLIDPEADPEVEIWFDEPEDGEEPVAEYVDGHIHALRRGNVMAHYTVTTRYGETYTRDLMIRVDQYTMPNSIEPEHELFVVSRNWRQHYAPFHTEPEYTGVELEFSSGNEDILGFDEGKNSSEMYFHGGSGKTTVYVGCPENDELNFQFDVLVIDKDEDFYFVATQGDQEFPTEATFAPGDTFKLDLRNIHGVELPEGTIESIEYRNYYDDDQFTVTEDGLVTITQMWDELEETKNLWAFVNFSSGLRLNLCYSFYVDASSEPFFFLSPSNAIDIDHFTLAPGSGVYLKLLTNQEWTSGSDAFVVTSSNPEVATAEFNPDEDGILVHAQSNGDTVINATIPLDDGEGNVTGETMTAAFPIHVETPTEVNTSVSWSTNSNVLYVGEEIELYTHDLYREVDPYFNFDLTQEYSVDNSDVADLVLNIVGKENSGGRDWMTLRALNPGTVTVTSTAWYENYCESEELTEDDLVDVQTMTFHVVERPIIGLDTYAEVAAGASVALPITLYCERDELTGITVESANPDIVFAELTYDDSGNPYATLIGLAPDDDAKVHVTATLTNSSTQTVTVTAVVYGDRIALLTGSTSQGAEEYIAASMLVKEYGSNCVLHETYPENFIAEIDRTISKIETFGADPSVKAIVVAQGVPGTVEGMSNVRETCEEENREAPLMIIGVPQDDPSIVSRTADFALMSNEVGQADTIAETLAGWDIDVFVHCSFPRHLAMSTIAERKIALENKCEALEIQYVELTIPDPTSDAGMGGLQQFIAEEVPAKMEEFPGKKVAFFATVCGAQAALQSAVLLEENAYYPQPCCPSPYEGFGESLGLDLDYGDSESALREIAASLDIVGAAGRFSTWAAPVNMAIVDIAGAYAMAYTDGTITDRFDSDQVEAMIEERFPGATVGHLGGYDNMFTILLDPVDFADYLND